MKLFRFVSGLVLGLLVSGCASYAPRDLTLGASYQPANVFVSSPLLPPTLKRLAILPLAAEAGHTELTDAVQALEPVLRAELAKTRKFEIVPVNPEFLRARTGLPAWSGQEALPQDFLEAVRQATGGDAVLFCQLTTYRGYAPLAVGWRMRLVEISTGTTLWAADEVFDAGQPAVLAGARRYQLAELRTADGAPEEWAIDNSPRQFGQYAAAQLLATLPGR